ncbi:MAG: tetratricopeptide repeat protein, partial [Candidatus Krumholzibacteriota bacterium]|nr:tetratricopeptide repeat protein [Candidatus Krumholzibacteriota bacterium]
DTGGGRLQGLTIAWDTAGRRWFHLYPDERILPDDPLHWTGVLQNWNGRCADCHSTNFVKGYNDESNLFQSTWSEVNVGCEACHGPGSEHIKAASAETYREEASGLVVNFAAGAPEFEVERCAPCHSRRHPVRVENHYGEPMLDDYVPTLLRTGLYHAGGQILDEVYVYGSFAQSKMYGAGVRCSDCHNPHTLELKVEGDALCIGCHNPAGEARFPTLPRKRYDTPEHHFHPAQKVAVSCVGCHMIERNYMVVDPRHDHSFRIPRPDLSATIGTPNACTDCHNDKSAQWAADAITSWYGTERPQHWGDVFARTENRSPRQQRALARIADDAAAPVIVRATAIEHLEAYGPSDPIIRALADRDPLIRHAGVAALDAFPVAQRGTLAAPRLHDSVRAVRLEAARVLSSVPREGLVARDANAWHLLIREYEDLQRANGDMAASHLNLGVLYEHKDRPDAAQREYRKALGINTYLQPARHNLANLYNRTGRNREAERILREGIELAPDDGEFHYSLGLLLGEESRMEESAETLGRAADLLPYRARVRY